MTGFLLSRGAMIVVLLVALGPVPSRPDGNEPTEVLALSGGDLEVQLEAVPPALGPRLVRSWIETSARAVAAYDGTFPVARARLILTVSPGHGVGHGTVRGGPVPELQLSLGSDTSPSDLDRDWVLVHELVHLGFPSVARRHHWMEEGLATYVEPIARARIGALPAARVWADLVDGLPKGLPREGDLGLDRTPTWGRTYWGGALFWLLADVELRKRSGNQSGLEVALRAIVRRGGTIGHVWDVDKVIAAGDDATGYPVLRELYDRMSTTPAPVDLDALWSRLGVRAVDGSVSFDDAAPLSAIRRAITEGP